MTEVEIKTYIQERISDLQAIKEEYNLVSMAEIRKNKANMKEVDIPREDENDFRTQVSATVSRRYYGLFCKHPQTHPQSTLSL